MAEEMDTESASPRGTKRTADVAQLPEAPRRIKALSQDVVNKIAAGEIIVAPVHALKELIENAVDAGSTGLEIVIKDGGLKLLQITDNGSGIDREDLAILCERFTTSKLKAFEDLTSIGTYGFRGEALASISHIAHLSVTTKTNGSSCAWRAHYGDGKLVPSKPGQTAEPKPIAGRQGTQITVEDLFYNVPSRRRAFRSASEEYAKILDLVGRYAVHCAGVSFTCKKHGDSNMGITVPANASTVDRIRQVHGSGVANELIQFKASNDRWGFKSDGWVSNANYSVKRTALLLFINHRSVESSNIKKAVEQTYATFLPKGGHPFIYLSLEIDPHRVDVNVHPTKREVNFLNEDEIIEIICDEIRTSLGKVDTSRAFMTQSLLPGAKIPLISTSGVLSGEDDVESPGVSTPAGKSQKAPGSKTATKKPYENNLVRTDASVRKITSMLVQTQHPSSGGDITATEDIEYEDSEKEMTLCRLTTIKELRSDVRDAMHNELTDIFASHAFVGVVDERRRIVAIQSSVKLYLIDYGMLCNEFFYQIGLTDFGNFGAIRFSPVLSLQELLQIAAAHEKDMAEIDDETDWDEVVTTVRQCLISHKDMLAEYFSIEISEEGELLAIPLFMKGYMPSLAKLPQFLLRLGPHVDWTDEKECFRSFLRELASFYVPESLPLPRTSDADGVAEGVEDAEIAARRKHLLRAIEYVIFPAIKARLVATKGLLHGPGVLEVANLPGLYRIFERC
ncbi:DNA mismatch repair protein MutL [Mytilinidion resinicola]|uniref:DNA mismatch repair protein MutL n=1 Tax=Mytilinidion resinicola TaxID=574789 RepID=A0A6A6Y2M4_9PEZI|nr:DNA mismatch repair protein MutL [Mytilinidion resinicola]KAF2803076.1 DNA mismatch repair protein MutL [Mytilinidion resinicola]